jgi:ABC-type branched-subunit amino acid transport system substrate-binding protein
MVGTRLARLVGMSGALLAAGLTARCTMADLDAWRQIEPPPQMIGGGMSTLPAPGQPGGQSFGTGPVRVALLLPLSGDPRLSSVGTAMANGARLAMDFIAQSPNIGDNVKVTLRDTGGTGPGAANAASAAAASGASIILGPLTGAGVVAAGSVARAAGIPLIGFSNTESAAAPGVYLLSVLPSVEVRRSLTYARAQGKKSVAAILPATAYGQAQLAALQAASASLGLATKGVQTFNGPGDIARVVNQMLPAIKSADALFIPDRTTAPEIGRQLQAAGIDARRLMVIGSADWQGDPLIANSAFFNGAVYPAVDEAGLDTIRPAYVAKFGTEPHPLTTIAYTATILANAAPLSMAPERYSRAVLTAPAGFRGRDGVFRFLPDGRADYALVMKRIAPGGPVTVDGAKL